MVWNQTCAQMCRPADCERLDLSGELPASLARIVRDTRIHVSHRIYKLRVGDQPATAKSRHSSGTPLRTWVP